MISFTQINLQHSKSATAKLCSSLARQMKKQQIILVQEPWIFRNKICGYGILNCYTILHKSGIARPRTCIIVSNMIEAILLDQFSDQDTTVVKIAYKSNGLKREALIVSAYFPYDSLLPPPPKAIEAIISYAESKKLELIIGCDANSQHTVWSSTKCNKRGEKLLDFILSYDLSIQNVGNSPTFINRVRQEIIDLTLTNRLAANLIQNWKVVDEDSLSDHRYIGFQLGADLSIIPEGRNPRKTDWTRYNELVDNGLSNQVLPQKIHTVAKLNEYTNNFCDVLRSSYEEACPIRKERSGKTVPWWNRELEKLRKVSRKLLNRALKTRKETDWNTYKTKQNEYKKLIRSSKTDSFRNFCSEIEEVKDTARLCKILQKDKVFSSISLQDKNGRYTTSKKEANELLLQTHFPKCWNLNEVIETSSVNCSIGSTRKTWYRARCIMSEEAIDYSLSTFQDYKAPGPDNTYPKMLKNNRITTKALRRIYTSSLALGAVPKILTEVRVAFIPKPGKSDYSLPKSFRPISLSSFILKGMERIIEKHITVNVLKSKPLNQNQHAYQAGKSCDSALHDLTSRIENSLDANEYTLCVFIDIEGAFDNATFDSMCHAAESFGVEHFITKWIRAMLSTRRLHTGGDSNKVEVGVQQGCPQGGVLSPLLWCFVVDSLLNEISNMDVHIQAYADDVCLLASGKNLRILCTKIQRALNKLDEWCNRNGLNANPSKTTLVMFTRKRKISGLIPITLKGVVLQIFDEVKYLGVILDKKLSWKKHLEDKTSKALNAFWQCRRAFGKTWGLSPYMVYWIYTMLIRPVLTYGAVVWWPRTKQKSALLMLNKIQRTATLAITGAMSTTSGEALDAILGLLPLDLMIQKVALKTLLRLKNNNLCNQTFTKHGEIIKEVGQHIPMLMMPTDDIPKTVKFGRKYGVKLVDRNDWDNPDRILNNFTHVFFTDGSMTDEGCGAGWTLLNGVQKSYPLGRLATVFQTEIFAIIKMADWIIKNKLKGNKIVVCSDSQAGLQALCLPESRSKLVQECKFKLNSVARWNNIELIWVPGHCGIEGNEIADELARSGSSTKAIGPEPKIGISSAHISRWIDHWFDQIHKERWQSTEKCKHSKYFVKEPSKKLSSFILKLNRIDCKVMIGTITGHSTNGKHLVKLGLKTDSLCQSCLEEDDTPEHKLCDCPAFARTRLNILKSTIVDVNHLHTITFEDILSFLRKSGMTKH